MTAPKILVVEDESVVALDLQTRLTRLGYHVVEATAYGETAVEIAARLRPDLVLMDIRLRGEMDGITAADLIRTRLNVPVIYLTAHADEGTVKRARITEPFGYILKPFDERELRTIIEMAIYKHQADKRLRESERRYATTLSSIGDAVIATDREGRITFMNPVAQDLTGWPMADASGLDLKAVFQICNEDTRAVVASPVERVLAEGVVVGLANHTRLISRDGREVPIDDCAAPILDDDGALTGAVLVFRDVSESRRVDEHLRHAQKMEAVGQLAGGISHDFNNMLTIILNYSEILLNAAGPDHPWYNFLSEIHRAGERSSDLTRQLLMFCRRQMFEPRVVDLNESVLRTEQMLRRLIGEHIELQVRLQPDLGTVKMDPGQIERILVNLAVNARDAISEQGSILIETFNVELRPQQIPHLTAGTYRCLRVTDSGQGIASIHRNRVFEPFFTTKEPGKGTGLGLASVYGIVQQGGGHVEFETEIGRGTSFTVYLPVAGEAHTVDPAFSRMQLPQGSETILLVEDESAVRSLSRHLLSTCGYHVLEAENGADAILVARRHAGTIDLVVTDVVMPVMGARHMLQHIEPYLRGKKVIFLSGYSDESLLPELGALFTTSFIQKPFTFAELATTVRRMLDHGSANSPREPRPSP